MDVDAMTGVGRPRSRWVWAVAAIVLPVVVIGGGAAWFINTYYIAPPMVSILEPPQLASYEPPLWSLIELAPGVESGSKTTPAPPRPLMSGINTSIWPSVSSAPSSASAYASVEPAFNPPGGTGEASEPIAGPIPLPPPRPRISSALQRGNVPVSRPRRGTTEQD
jgi:hypothetical protein